MTFLHEYFILPTTHVFSAALLLPQQRYTASNIFRVFSLVIYTHPRSRYFLSYIFFRPVFIKLFILLSSRVALW